MRPFLCKLKLLNYLNRLILMAKLRKNIIVALTLLIAIAMNSYAFKATAFSAADCDGPVAAAAPSLKSSGIGLRPVIATAQDTDLNFETPGEGNTQNKFFRQGKMAVHMTAVSGIDPSLT